MLRSENSKWSYRLDASGKAVQGHAGWVVYIHTSLWTQAGSRREQAAFCSGLFPLWKHLQWTTAKEKIMTNAKPRVIMLTNDPLWFLHRGCTGPGPQSASLDPAGVKARVYLSLCRMRDAIFSFSTYLHYAWWWKCTWLPLVHKINIAARRDITGTYQHFWFGE